MRGWRNRQTRWIQVPVSERTWGFNSPLAHRETPTKWVSAGDGMAGRGPFLVVGGLEAWSWGLRWASDLRFRGCCTREGPRWDGGLSVGPAW
jgi:hypothetical protein